MKQAALLFCVRRRWNEQKTMQSATAVLFALPRTVPVLAAVPERLTTVVEQPVEAQSWEVDAVSGGRSLCRLCEFYEVFS